ncbi:hypothetical protein OU789_02650 [Halocynthiibacter sp. C4]|uniref:hypothetical protein n=1 Tax=Halocynthiibacter sp. C4 TaxID=2992758 RepID=UPI00237AD1E0|nr:hypothetical protein [Halocynthiibacter sp. C4]MDE0588822.1 hypothetical protein [Halocynthiibacter sp. C4]
MKTHVKVPRMSRFKEREYLTLYGVQQLAGGVTRNQVKAMIEEGTLPDATTYINKQLLWSEREVRKFLKCKGERRG